MHGYCWLPVGGVKALFGQAVGPQVQHVGVLVDLFLFSLKKAWFGGTYAPFRLYLSLKEKIWQPKMFNFLQIGLKNS